MQRRERVKSAHSIADFQTLNQRQAQARRRGVRVEQAFGSDFFQAGLAVVELDEVLALRAQKVNIVAAAVAVAGIVVCGWDCNHDSGDDGITSSANIQSIGCFSRDVPERRRPHRARQGVQPD